MVLTEIIIADILHAVSLSLSCSPIIPAPSHWGQMIARNALHLLQGLLSSIPSSISPRVTHPCLHSFLFLISASVTHIRYFSSPQVLVSSKEVSLALEPFFWITSKCRCPPRDRQAIHRLPTVLLRFTLLFLENPVLGISPDPRQTLHFTYCLPRQRGQVRGGARGRGGSSGGSARGFASSCRRSRQSVDCWEYGRVSSSCFWSSG